MFDHFPLNQMLVFLGHFSLVSPICYIHVTAIRSSLVLHHPEIT